MSVPSEIDPLEFFLPENDLPHTRREPPRTATQTSGMNERQRELPQVRPATGQTGPLRRQQLARRRLLVMGSLTVWLAVGVVWLATRPTQGVDGASAGGPPSMLTRTVDAAPRALAVAEEGAGPIELGVAVERSSQVDPEGAVEQVVTSELDAEMAASDETQPARLSLGDSGVGTDVVARQLVGQSDSFPSGSDVVFWTLMLGGRPGDEVRHVWLLDGRTVSTVTLPIGSPQWRTYSRLNLEPDEVGNWLVEARDIDDRVLVQHRFRSEPPF